MIADAEVESPEFERLLFDMIERPEVRDAMQAAAATFETEDAAGKLADVVEAAAAKRKPLQ